MSRFVQRSQGLHQLLNALARRDAMAESSADRKLRHQQMMMQLEEMRANTVLKREQVELDKARFAAQLGVQKFQMDLQMLKAKTDAEVTKVNVKQAVHSMGLAQEANDRQNRLTEAQLKKSASEEAYNLVKMLRQSSSDARELATVGFDAIEQRLNAENDRARLAIQSMFGVPQVSADGETATFVPMDRYKKLMEQYAKGSGLKGADYQMVVTMWTNGIMDTYQAIASAKLDEVNANRPQEEQIRSVEKLSNNIKAGLVKEAMDSYFSGRNGIIATAAKGAMGDKKYSELANKLGPVKLHNALIGSFRNLGTKGVKFESPNSKGEFSDGGTDHVGSYVADIYSVSKNAMDDAVPMLAHADVELGRMDGLRAEMMEQAYVYQRLAQAEEAAIFRGQHEGLTPEQKSAHRETVYKKVMGFRDIEDLMEGQPDAVQGPVAPNEFLARAANMVDDLADPQNTVDLIASVDQAGEQLPQWAIPFQPPAGDYGPEQRTKPRRTLGGDILGASQATFNAVHGGVSGTGRGMGNAIIGIENWIEGSAMPYLTGIPGPDMFPKEGIPLPEGMAAQAEKEAAARRRFAGFDVFQPFGQGE